MANIIKIPDGNAFKLRITGNIKIEEYSEEADFSVINSLKVNFVRRSRIAQTSVVNPQGKIVVENEGNLACGIYGVELTGYYNGEPWRYFMKDVFEIIDETEEADPGTSVDNVLTYDVSMDVSFGGDGVSAAFVEAVVNMHNNDESSHPSLLGAIGRIVDEIIAMKENIAHAGKVDDVKVDGKSIVDENKVAHIDSDQFGKVDDVKVNGSSVVSEKVADITMPTKVSDLENDSDFATKQEAQQMADDAKIDTVSVDYQEDGGAPDASASIEDGKLAFSLKNMKMKFSDLTAADKAELKGKDGASGAQGPQGPQGNSGYTGAAGELEVVNNLTDGGEEAALSAEMGKELKQNISDQSSKDSGLQIRYCQFIAVDEEASTGLPSDCVKISGILSPSTGEITGAGTAKRWVLDIDLSKRDWSVISGFYSNSNFTWGYFDSAGAWVNKTGTNPVAIPRGATRLRYGIHSDWIPYPTLNGYYRSIILYDTSERLIHSDLSEVTIDSLNWCRGYLNTSGKLVSSSSATSKSRYSQPFLLTKGRTVKVTGSSSRLALATKDRVNINDTFTLVGTTYTAIEDVLMIVSIDFAAAYTFAVTPSSLPVRVTNIEDQLANDSARATTMDAYNPEKKYILPALRAKGKPSETISGGGTKASLDYYPCVMVATDLHADVNTGVSNPPSSWWPAIDRAISYSQDNDIDAVLSLGDNYNGLYSTLRDKAIAASKPVLMIVGNHDAFFGATIISKTNVMSNYYSSSYVDKQNTLTSNNYHQEDGKPYWYVDLPARDGSSAKLRIISIMEYEHVYSDGATASNTDRISKAQYDWLASVLTSCDANTHVVIAKHQPMLLGSTICEAWNALSPFGYSGNNNDNADSRFSGCIAKIVDAWIHGTSVDVIIGGDTITYSFASSHLANFGCYIVGHAHLDACNYVKDYPEQICVTFCNACPNPFQSWSDLPRTISGKLYDCVTVFSYDWNNRIVKLLRIGSDTTIDGRERKYVTFKLPNITA